MADGPSPRSLPNPRDPQAWRSTEDSPPAFASNDNSSEVSNGPSVNDATTYELGFSPGDFKSFLKYIAKKEAERDIRDQERARREDERAERLERILTGSLQKAIVEAIKPPPSQDATTRFWNAYRTISEEHDGEVCAKYNSDLDTSLIFAGLFSAVSSAFIIQIQSALQQDPNIVTQALLRILIHSTNSSIFSGPDLIIPQWNGPPPSAVATESMLYISFFATLLVALLAVLGKQWLAYYTGVGMRGTVEERGIERQKKFDGFRKWGFAYVMEALPMLLQLSLLLFSVAVTVSLWTVDRTIAGMVLCLSLLTIVLYLSFVFSHVLATDSPFRTPLSTGLLKIPWIRGGSQSVAEAFNDMSSLYNEPRSQKVQLQDPEVPLHVLTPGRREEPLFEPHTTTNKDEYGCLAVLWMLDTSTEPSIVATAASIAVELQWSPNIDFSPPLTRLRDTFMECFEISPGLRLRESAKDHAIACGQAYYHLYAIRRSMQLVEDEVEFPTNWFSRIIDNDSKGLPFESAELNFIYSLLRGRLPEIEYSLFSLPFYKWALHISPYHIYSNPAFVLSYPPDYFNLFQPSSLGALDRSDFTNSLLHMGGYLGLPLNNHDLAVMNKSNYYETVMEDLLQHLVRYHEGPRISAGISQVFEIIVVLLKKMDSPLDFHYLRHKRCIDIICKSLPKEGTIAGKLSRSSATFHALHLLSSFTNGRPEYFPLLGAPADSFGEDEELIWEVSKIVYNRFDELHANDRWEDSVMETVVEYLRVLVEVPHLGRYKPSRDFFHILSRSMPPDNSTRDDLQHLAYSVIWLSRGHWLGDDDLLPVLQEMNIFNALGAVADGNLSLYGPSYMHMVGQLSCMHAWVPIIKYHLFRWMVLEEDRHAPFVEWTVEQRLGIQRNVALALKNVSGVGTDGLLGKETEMGNTSVLVVMALENVWRTFDFSARIAIESFCKLAKCTWSLSADIPQNQSLSLKAAGKPYTVRLALSIQHARNTLLERWSQGPLDEMRQDSEVAAVEKIAEELAHMEENLWADVVQDFDAAFQRSQRIKDLHRFLLQVLAHPRCYLGIV